MTQSLTADLVSAFLKKNRVAAADVPDLVRSFSSVVVGAGAAGQKEQVSRQPACHPKKSVTSDYIICLDCGKRFKSLKRHLHTAHGLAVGEYLARWDLPAEYPMVAPKYALRRVELAKGFGLGRKAVVATKPMKASAMPPAAAPITKPTVPTARPAKPSPVTTAVVTDTATAPRKRLGLPTAAVPTPIPVAPPEPVEQPKAPRHRYPANRWAKASA